MQKSKQTIRQPQSRAGAVLVEAAITMPLFVVLVLGMLDLGIGVLHYNTISECARTGARAAVVHGSLAPSNAGFGGPWNDATAEVQITALIRPLLNAVGVTDSVIDAPATGSDPQTVTVVHTDGSDAGASTNDPGDPFGNPADTVRVTVVIPYTPLMAFIFGTNTLQLTASSTMFISH